MLGLQVTLLALNLATVFTLATNLANRIYMDQSDDNILGINFPIGRVYYSIKSNSTDRCVNQLEAFKYLLNKTWVLEESEKDLLVSIPFLLVNCATSFNQSTLSFINLRIALNLNVDVCNPDLFTLIHAVITRLRQGNSILAHIEFGVEYNDFQINSCVGFTKLHDIVDFVVIKTKLEANVDSNRLFRRKMVLVQHKNQKLFNKLSKTGLVIVYYPTWDAEVGQNEPEKLKQLSKTWLSNQGNMSSVQIILAPTTFPKNSTTDISHKRKKAVVIPSILETKSYNETAKWYSDNALNAIQEKFSTVLLNYDQWIELVTSPASGKMDLPHIIVDCSFSSTEYGNWSAIPESLISNSTVKDRLTRFVLPISQEEPEVLKEVAKHPQFQIGYSFRIDKDLSTEFPWDSLLNHLQNKEDSFLILNIDAGFLPADHNHFVNVTLKLLNAAKLLRSEIRERTFVNDVYLRVVNQYKMGNYPVTVFCNDQVLSVNVYFEGILNWTKGHDFPLILKSAFDTFDAPHISSWMSILRPYDSINRFYADSKQTQVSKVPFFVMRNYPTNINGWETDPCINWWEEETPLNFTPTFFKNDQLGAIVNLKIRKDTLTSAEEVQTLFQFAVHRFSAIELVLQNPEQIMNAIDAVSQEYFSVIENFREGKGKGKMYLNLKLEENDITSERLAQTYTKFSLLERNNLVSLEGMHFHYSDVLDVEKKGQKHIFHLVANDRMATNIPTGLIFSRLCLDELLFVTELKKALKNVQYVVCPENILNVDSAKSGMYNLGTIFDTQLYVKKVFNLIKPGIKVMFSMELDIYLSELDAKKMHHYLRILHHIQQFGAAYDIQYFLVEAFDKVKELERTSNGWWTFTNFTNLSDPNAYVEKATEIQGLGTWKPQTHFSRTAKPQKERAEAESKTAMILMVSGMSVGLLILAVCSFFLGIRYRKTQARQYLTSEEVKEFRNGDLEMNALSESNTPPEHLRFCREYELSLADFTIDFQKILGKGTFGIVYSATVKEQEAAAKSPTAGCGKETFKNILTEIKVLCHLGNHQHLVKFLGAYVNEIQNGKLYIATELCSNGSLESFLRRRKNSLCLDDDHDGREGYRCLHFPELCRYSLEIALGMEYIVSRKVVHGDLAARNVMLNSEHVCKIGDFGLSRKLYEYEKYMKESQEPLPWKWMAFESLASMEFTSMSDMWGYGVTIWEIFSMGNVPYAGLNWSPQFPDELRNGLRLPAPQFASEPISEKLQECWNLKAQDRPTFSDMVNFFKILRSTEYVDLTQL